MMLGLSFSAALSRAGGDSASAGEECDGGFHSGVLGWEMVGFGLVQPTRGTGPLRFAL